MKNFESVETISGEFIAQVTIHYNHGVTTGYSAICGDVKATLVNEVDRHINRVLSKEDMYDCLHLLNNPVVTGRTVSFYSDMIFPGEYLRNRCHISYRIVRISDMA